MQAEQESKINNSKFLVLQDQKSKFTNNLINKNILIEELGELYLKEISYEFFINIKDNIFKTNEVELLSFNNSHNLTNYSKIYEKLDNTSLSEINNEEISKSHIVSKNNIYDDLSNFETCRNTSYKIETKKSIDEKFEKELPLILIDGNDFFSEYKNHNIDDNVFSFIEK